MGEKEQEERERESARREWISTMGAACGGLSPRSQNRECRLVDITLPSFSGCTITRSFSFHSWVAMANLERLYWLRAEGRPETVGVIKACDGQTLPQHNTTLYWEYGIRTRGHRPLHCSLALPPPKYNLHISLPRLYIYICYYVCELEACAHI